MFTGKKKFIVNEPKLHRKYTVGTQKVLCIVKAYVWYYDVT